MFEITTARRRAQIGFSALEVIIALVILGILTAVGSKSIARFGPKGRLSYESGRLVDHLWELRSLATTGVSNPCMDFLSDSIRVRLYLDRNPTPNGFNTGTDSVLLVYPLTGKIKTLKITGGVSSTHYVCFESRGVSGSAMTALEIVLGTSLTEAKTIRLLPSTGIARIK